MRSLPLSDPSHKEAVTVFWSDGSLNVTGTATTQWGTFLLTFFSISFVLFLFVSSCSSFNSFLPRSIHCPHLSSVSSFSLFHILLLIFLLHFLILLLISFLLPSILSYNSPHSSHLPVLLTIPFRDSSRMPLSSYSLPLSPSSVFYSIPLPFYFLPLILLPPPPFFNALAHTSIRSGTHSFVVTPQILTNFPQTNHYKTWPTLTKYTEQSP